MSRFCIYVSLSRVSGVPWLLMMFNPLQAQEGCQTSTATEHLDPNPPGIPTVPKKNRLSPCPHLVRAGQYKARHARQAAAELVPWQGSGFEVVFEGLRGLEGSGHRGSVRFGAKPPTSRHP